MKNARRAEGLTQSVVDRKAEVPQSHVSVIENDGVDFRVSSLVQLALAPHLEQMFVPRRTAPVVQAVIRGGAGESVRPAYRLDEGDDG